jgi:hypothetical protein
MTDVEAPERGPAAEPKTVVLGLLAAPGLASDLAEQLARDLPGRLAARYPEVAWRVQVEEEPLAGAGHGWDVDLVGISRRRMLAEGWDLVVCLTDFPLLVRRHPVTAHVSVTHGVGLVSVPALGAVALESRVEQAVLRVVDGLLGERFGRPRRSGRSRARVRMRLDELTSPVGHAVREGGTIRFVGEVVRGNLRLLLGMIRANRPWRLIAGLSRALVAALGAGAFGMVSTGVWRVANGLSAPRLVGLCLAAVLITCVTLIVAHGLWEHTPSPAARERVVLFNLATAITVFLGVVTLFAALLAITTASAVAVIAADVLRSELGHPVGFGDYLRVGLVLSMLATIGGALGSALESDEVVRQAAYGYQPGDD